MTITFLSWVVLRSSDVLLPPSAEEDTLWGLTVLSEADIQLWLSADNPSCFARPVRETDAERKPFGVGRGLPPFGVRGRSRMSASLW